MKKVIASVAILAMFLTGCGSDASTDEPSPTGNTNVTDVTKIAVDGDTDNTVYEFTTQNGTRCVFVDGDQESGLACSFPVDTP